VACLIPFNYPVYTLLRKIAPALIAGNTVVVRPSNNTPLSAFEIAKAVVKAGIPAGVINILTMDHATAASVCTHKAVGLITLTGSVNAGRIVLDYCKANIAKPSLELGGKTPAIIEADADLEKAASAIVASKTTHCGQLCTAVERGEGHESIYDAFLALLKSKISAVKFGDRATDTSLMGPLVNASSQQNIHAMVERAVAAGAVLETGGVLPEGPQRYIAPTLLKDVAMDDAIMQEEIFGPVLPMLTYSTLEELIVNLKKLPEHPLALYLFTSSDQVERQVLDNTQFGGGCINNTVMHVANPNLPFGGVGESGMGAYHGKNSFDEIGRAHV